MNYIKVLPSPTSFLIGHFIRKESPSSMDDSTTQPKAPRAFEALYGNISTSGLCIKVGNLFLKFELTSIKICAFCSHFPPHYGTEEVWCVIVIMAMKTVTLDWVLTIRHTQCWCFTLSICFMKLYPIRKLPHCVVNRKEYALKHTIARNGCFVQESLHKFPNFMDLWIFSFTYSQTLWPASRSSQLPSDFLSLIPTNGTVWSTGSQG